MIKVAISTIKATVTFCRTSFRVGFIWRVFEGEFDFARYQEKGILILRSYLNKEIRKFKRTSLYVFRTKFTAEYSRFVCAQDGAKARPSVLMENQNK